MFVGDGDNAEAEEGCLASLSMITSGKEMDVFRSSENEEEASATQSDAPDMVDFILDAVFARK